MEFTIRGPFLNAARRYARYILPTAFRQRWLQMPVMETERLALRPFHRQDIQAIAAWDAMADTQNAEAAAQEFLDYCTREYRDRGIGPWAIQHKETNTVIGNCGFPHIDFKERCGEVNCYVAPPYRARGLATEALLSLFFCGFTEFEFERIQARVDLDNLSSQRLAEKSGMKFEGFLESRPTPKDPVAKQKLYSIMISDFRMERAPTAKVSIRIERPSGQPARGGRQ